jgi:DNA-binding transcriptional ArsR family regulator
VLDITIFIHYRLVVNTLDSTFSALADPTRRAMVIKLTRAPASIHELNEPFSLSQQMISKHVACLVRAKIVLKQRRGRESICTLRAASIKGVADWALDFQRLWEKRFDNLDTVLQEMKGEEKAHGKTSDK